jgi:hypothetical protein
MLNLDAVAAVHVERHAGESSALPQSLRLTIAAPSCPHPLADRPAGALLGDGGTCLDENVAAMAGMNLSHAVELPESFRCL